MTEEKIWNVFNRFIGRCTNKKVNEKGGGNPLLQLTYLVKNFEKPFFLL